MAVYLFLRHAPDLPAGADGTREDAAVLCHYEDTQSPGHAPRDGLLRAGDIQHFADRGSEYVPDSQQQAYNCFFDDLDEAADILAAWVEEQPEAASFPGSTCFSTAAIRPGSVLPTPCACALPCVSRCRARKGPCGIPEGGAGGPEG